MSKSCCPLITCRLTDQDGNLVSPYEPDSIQYTVLATPEHFGAGGRYSVTHNLQVAITGYIVIYSNGEKISAPIPFCMIETLCRPVPKGSCFNFQVKGFHCWADPVWCEENSTMERIKLLISVETLAYTKATASLLVPQVDSDLHVIDCVYIQTNQISDGVRFRSGGCICYKNYALKADISQYNAISDGVKRTYLNSDELTQYGHQGILSPLEVSYYNVFVNAVLQPKANYILKEGELTFITEDVPSKDQAVMILFNTLKAPDGERMEVTDWQYNVVSDGVKKIYTNDDELKEYGDHGIPSPSEVSYFNLYINGVLQPQVNYKVKRGILELTTTDAPTKGSPIILESIAIRDPAGQLFHMEAYAYNAQSNGGNLYTNQDEIQMYGNQGISGPDESFYQSLFVNGVLQPDVNYMAQNGYLILETEDSPTIGAPISLQSVNNSPVPLCCKTLMSDAALVQWEKEYAHIKKPCLPAKMLQGTSQTAE
ncbi:DUF4183 domain-containing protein [Faecalispora anaeroviscerum]|uniref:DUF4183 domain-containing protein n=1 Tax=Faecalispora anaeroviscerum TaxID=2991836 RepID=UPI0024BA4941|nr:DUF4183 domain-containing protein [Faecalispora anaeroviscerum]